MKTIKAISILLCILIFSGSMSGQNTAANTAEMMIGSVIKQTAGAPVPNTVDVIKAGDPQATVILSGADHRTIPIDGRRFMLSVEAILNGFTIEQIEQIFRSPIDPL